MARKVWKLGKFDKGINSHTDPKDIKDNEWAELEDVNVSKVDAINPNIVSYQAKLIFDQITGEMTNPWYDNAPPALDFRYANQGGIMNLDNGGDISGPGTGTSDSINAKVSDGEFIFTDKAVENFGGGDRQVGARRMYAMMNQLDPQSQTPAEGMV